MNTNQLKRFAQAARIRLLEDVKNRFLYWGIDQGGNVDYSVETTTGGYLFRGGVFNDESVPKKWDNLLNAVKHHTPNDTIEDIIKLTPLWRAGHGANQRACFDLFHLTTKSRFWNAEHCGAASVDTTDAIKGRLNKIFL